MAIGIHPLTASIGAEITGVDLADLSDETVEELRKAWLDHKVLVLRDQHITQEQHIAFGRQFGDLEINPFTQNEEGRPEIVVLEAGGDTRKTFVAAGWHSDVTWRAEPSMGSILRGVIVPPYGGDTASPTRARHISVCPTSGRSGSTISSRCTTTCGCFLTALRPPSVRPCGRRTAAPSRDPHPSRDGRARDLHQHRVHLAHPRC